MPTQNLMTANFVLALWVALMELTGSCIPYLADAPVARRGHREVELRGFR